MGFSSHVEAASKTAIHENAENPLGRVDSGGTIAGYPTIDLFLELSLRWLYFFRIVKK